MAEGHNEDRLSIKENRDKGEIRAQQSGGRKVVPTPGCL